MKSLAVLLLLALACCTNEDGAREALEGMGYTNITIEGYDPFSCAKSDDTCTKFEADGPTGKRVKGVVGCGFLFKGCTVRFK